MKALISVFDNDAKRVGIKLMPMGGFNDVGMPEKDTRETFGYLLEELEKLEIAYVSLMRTPSTDPELAAGYDCVAQFSKLLKNTNLFIGGDVRILLYFEVLASYIRP